MQKFIQQVIVTVLSLYSILTWSQERKKDTISTEVIDVVKPYAPSVSDAFKVKETPAFYEGTNQNKKEVKFNIFSFPVASTFVPSKGTAAAVEKQSPVKLYDNYATLEGGTYTTIVGDIYFNHALSQTKSIGGYLRHHSSQDGIDGVPFENGFSNSKINLNYKHQSTDLNWQVESGFQHQRYHWYGVPDTQVFLAQENNIDVGHDYFDVFLGTDIFFQDGYLNSGRFFVRRFSDNQGSVENQLVAKAQVDIPVGDEKIETRFKFDYLKGSFEEDYFTNQTLTYRNIQMSIAPTYELKQDELTVKLGVSAYFLNDLNQDKNKIYMYPNILANYQMVKDVLMTYAGIQGGLIQNTYYDFANDNTFVSPTLHIQPTDQAYHVFVGLKGKLSRGMNYDISGRYIADRNKAIYKTNPIKNMEPQNDYSFGNSFGIIYDDVKTLKMSGEINMTVNQNFNLRIKAEYFAYHMDEQAEAWNLPDLKGSLFLDYQINQYWFVGANLFYMGKRQDQWQVEDSFLLINTETAITLDGYLDANTHLGYRINDQITVFAKVNNMTNKAYQKWQNYPVQQIQFLAGASFKFDF